MKISTNPLCALLVGTALLLTSADAFSQATSPEKSLTIGYPTATMPASTAYYSSVPLKLFVDPDKLNVRVVRMQGASFVVQALETGKIDVAMPATAATLAYLDKVPNADIVGFYTFINGFQSFPAVKPESRIKTLRELEGMTIGVQGLENSQVPLTRALVGMTGGDGSKVNFVAVGDGPEAAYALKSGRVEVLALFDGLYGQVEAAGVPIRFLTSPEVSRERVGLTGAVITKKTLFAQKRELFVHLSSAFAKATLFTLENPEAAIRIHWEMFPETRQRGVSEEEALRTAAASLKARLLNVYDVDGQFGLSTEQQIKGYIDLLRRGGVVKGSSEEVTFWDPSVLKEANSFDREQIRQMARNWGKK